MSSRVVVDASVAVKWAIAEEHSRLAEALRGRQMIAPSLLLIECGNALLRRARLGDLPADTIMGKVGALRIAPVRLMPAERHLEAAIRLLLNCAIRSMIVSIWRLRWSKECS